MSDVFITDGLIFLIHFISLMNDFVLVPGPVLVMDQSANL